jgi:type III secretion system low calcium response chaperone LcrH/SycD
MSNATARSMGLNLDELMAGNPELTRAVKDLRAADAALDDNVKAILGGLTLADVKGVTPRQMEGLYALGYQLYQAGDPKAEAIFAVLCLLNHQDKRFWLGLGGTRQRLGKPAEAAQAYGMAAMQDLLDPVPPLYAGLCFLSLHDKDNAASAMRQAALAAGDNPAYADYKKQSLATLKLLGAAPLA